MTNRYLSSAKYPKFCVYLILVVLLNIAGLTLFFRLDLTADKLYSLSDVSREVVATLTEPLTVNVFFSRNLPAPHNHTERYLRDLLAEYADAANTQFNYRFYKVSADPDDLNTEMRENQLLAANYGIHPIQIQVVEKDEIKFQKAYMGLVIVHGDQIEKIPAITTTDGLEYKLTTAVRKLNNKVSALLALTDKIQIRLYLSSSLATVAPMMRLDRLADIPAKVAQIVKELNSQYYGKLEFTHTDPATEDGSGPGVADDRLLRLHWPELDNGRIAAGSGIIGLILEHGRESSAVPLLHVVKIPTMGTRYQLANLDTLADVIAASVESLIDINQEIGILADFGSLPVVTQPKPTPMGRPGETASYFKAQASQNYTLKPVNLGEGKIPEGFDCLIIPGPKETFSTYDLFQIDQFLMQGKSLALIIDPLQRVESQKPDFQAAGFNFGYLPLASGLEKLLAHYGVTVQPSIVLDENCYRQQLPRQMGGGDRPIYFAPLIQNHNINDQLPYMQNIKGLMAAKASPISLDHERIAANGLTAHTLIRSSNRSWEMKEHIQFNPGMIKAPDATTQRQSFDLACMIEGTFPSYFAGKPLPLKPDLVPLDTDSAQAAEAAGAPDADADLAKIEGTPKIIERGRPGKLFVLASTEMMLDPMMDPAGRSPNSIFLMNILDYLNNRPEIAAMRSKQQRFVPLDETRAAAKTLVKTINIAGLPALVILFGLAVWLKRQRRKRRIHDRFPRKIPSSTPTGVVS